MIDIKIDSSDVEATIKRFSNPNILHDPMEASLALLHDFMARYPAQRAGSTYRRTGDYGRKWTEAIRPEGSGLYGELGNSVRSRRHGKAYGPYVGNEQRQSRYNTHWQTDADAIRQHEPQIQRYFDQALQRVADR